MTTDLSQSWLAEMGRAASRDGMVIAGLLAITMGAIALSLTTIVAIPALLFIARVLTALGGFFLALPLFLGGMSDSKWSDSLRIAGLVIGLLVILFTIIRI